jgi:hypothetical protein
MFPTLLHIGPFTIHTYGVFVALGFLAGFQYLVSRAARAGMPEKSVIDLVLYTIIAGLIGARLMYVLFNLPYYLRSPLEIFAVWTGGLVYYGGFISGAPWIFIPEAPIEGLRNKTLDFDKDGTVSQAEKDSILVVPQANLKNALKNLPAAIKHILVEGDFDTNGLGKMTLNCNIVATGAVDMSGNVSVNGLVYADNKNNQATAISLSGTLRTPEKPTFSTAKRAPLRMTTSTRSRPGSVWSAASTTTRADPFSWYVLVSASRSLRIASSSGGSPRAHGESGWFLTDAADGPFTVRTTFGPTKSA